MCECLPAHSGQARLPKDVAVGVLGGVACFELTPAQLRWRLINLC